MATQKMKPRWNTKISYDPAFQSLFHQGTFEARPTFLLYSNLETRFLLRGRNVTPRVTNSLIIVISVLIMHQFHWLIKFLQTERNSNWFKFKSLRESQEIPNFGIPNSFSSVDFSSQCNQEPWPMRSALLPYWMPTRAPLFLTNRRSAPLWLVTAGRQDLARAHVRAGSPLFFLSCGHTPCRALASFSLPFPPLCFDLAAVERSTPLLHAPLHPAELFGPSRAPEVLVHHRICVDKPPPSIPLMRTTIVGLLFDLNCPSHFPLPHEVVGVAQVVAGRRRSSSP
jgi:hypothetical protein